ncbi:MAG: fixJ, partial [Caulobacteraceae bacterium]|nr:fixJ [Caulobacteraceae bacterium]
QRGCIISDVRMPDMDGIALLAELRVLACPMPVIVITGHADVPLAVKAMKAGAQDFIEKPFESEALLNAVRRGLEVNHESDARETRRAGVARRLASLSERETQVVERLVEGASNKEIALALGISPRTVEIYRANVMSKMQAASLSELVRMMLVRESAQGISA